MKTSAEVAPLITSVLELLLYVSLHSLTQQPKGQSGLEGKFHFSSPSGGFQARCCRAVSHRLLSESVKAVDSAVLPFYREPGLCRVSRSSDPTVFVLPCFPIVPLSRSISPAHFRETLTLALNSLHVWNGKGELFEKLQLGIST